MEFLNKSVNIFKYLDTYCQITFLKSCINLNSLLECGMYECAHFLCPTLGIIVFGNFHVHSFLVCTHIFSLYLFKITFWSQST